MTEFHTLNRNHSYSENVSRLNTNKTIIHRHVVPRSVCLGQELYVNSFQVLMIIIYRSILVEQCRTGKIPLGLYFSHITYID